LREYFIVESHVVTIRSNGRRKLRPRTLAEGERTRIVVEGRIPRGAEPVVMYRRIGDPTFYYGQTLKMLLRDRGIGAMGRVRRALVPPGAVLLNSYDSPELAEVIRDMNKVSSNFIAEMLVKTLGAELKGTPGSWSKGLEVAEDLLAELGLPDPGILPAPVAPSRRTVTPADRPHHGYERLAPRIWIATEDGARNDIPPPATGIGEPESSSATT